MCVHLGAHTGHPCERVDAVFMARQAALKTRTAELSFLTEGVAQGFRHVS